MLRITENPYLLLVLKCFNRIRKKDIDYVRFALHDYHNPKHLLVQSYGGENYGKIIYRIRAQGQGYGFFAEFRALLCNLLFADEMGMMPDVLWGDKHLYFDKDVTETKNVFEYYFEPIHVEHASESKNIVLSSTCQNAYIEQSYGVTGYESTRQFEDALVKTIKKYIKIRADLVEDFETQIQSLFQNKRVLGVHHRGTDYKKAYNGHPVQIELDQEIRQVSEIKDKYDIDAIFLATDDTNLLKCYQEKFGDELICFEDTYRGKSDTSIAFSKAEREFHHYLLGKEVLRDMYTLSKCTCLVAGKSQVSFFAQIFNQCNTEQYEYIKILDNGLNKNKKYFKGR